MLALAGPCATLARPAVELAMLAAVMAALVFTFDALVAIDLDPSSSWRRTVFLLVRGVLSPVTLIAGAVFSVLFVLSMAEAHHALPYAAEPVLRFELGISSFSFLVCRAFAVLGGAGRRTISEEALRGQALRQQAAFSMLLEEKEAELIRLRVELAAREDSLRTLRNQASSQLKEQLADQDRSYEAMLRKKDN